MSYLQDEISEIVRLQMGLFGIRRQGKIVYRNKCVTVVALGGAWGWCCARGILWGVTTRPKGGLGCLGFRLLCHYVGNGGNEGLG